MMVARAAQGEDSMPIEPELAAEAGQAVRMTLRIRLTPPEWKFAGEAMARLAGAYDAGDAGALREAIRDLDDLASRITRKLGREPEDDDEAPPRDVMVTGYELIHRITPEMAADGGQDQA
jgi:CATRA-Associated Small Protein